MSLTSQSPRLGRFSGCHVYFFFTYSVDGGTQVPDGDMGVVMQNGVNLRFTDFAPESTVQAVSIALICDACIVFERRSSIVLLL